MKPSIRLERVIDREGREWERRYDREAGCSLKTDARVNGDDYEFRCMEPARWFEVGGAFAFCQPHFAGIAHL